MNRRRQYSRYGGITVEQMDALCVQHQDMSAHVQGEKEFDWWKRRSNAGREAAFQLVERRKREQDILGRAPAKLCFQRLLYRMVASLIAFFLSYRQ